MTPAHGFFDVVDASPLLEEAPQRFAVEGISRFEFTNGELGLGHGVSQRNTQPMKPLVDPVVFRGLTEVSDTVDFHPCALGQCSHLNASPGRTHPGAEHVGIKGVHFLEVVQVGQEHRGAHHP